MRCLCRRYACTITNNAGCACPKCFIASPGGSKACTHDPELHPYSSPVMLSLQTRVMLDASHAGRIISGSVRTCCCCALSSTVVFTTWSAYYAQIAISRHRRQRFAYRKRVQGHFMLSAAPGRSFIAMSDVYERSIPSTLVDHESRVEATRNISAQCNRRRIIRRYSNVSYRHTVDT